MLSFGIKCEMCFPQHNNLLYSFKFMKPGLHVFIATPKTLKFAVTGLIVFMSYRVYDMLGML